MLELLGKRIENGEMTIVTNIKTDPTITGTVTGISIQGNTIVVQTEDGKKTEVKVSRTRSVD